MGLDVNVYAEGDVTDEQLDEANRYLTARCEIVDDWQKTGRVIGRTEPGEYETPRVVLQTMSRYYGEGYERGSWPLIYGAIRLMQTCLPGCRVFYGSDSSDDGIECTDEYLAEIWAHFLGPNGDNYRTRVRAWNATKR